MTDISMPKATRAHAEKRHALAPAADEAFHAFSKAVFAPGLPDRIEVIRKAAYTINGRGDLAQQPAALPVFSLTPAPATATP